MSYKKIIFAALFSLTLFSTISFGLEELLSTNNSPIISRYAESLPKIGEPKNDITAQVIDYLLQLGDNNKFSPESFERYRSQINAIIESGETMKLLILGFPCKSKNTDTKVITDNFDLGDFLGLLTLQQIAEQIANIYEPGCEITIYNREPYIEKMGLIAFDKLNINPYPRECIDKYEATLMKLIKKFPNLKLPTIDLSEEVSEEYEVAYSLYTNKVSPPLKIVQFYANDLKTAEIDKKISSMLEEEIKILTVKRDEEFKKLQKEGKSTRHLKSLPKNTIKDRQLEIARLLADERERGSAILREILARRFKNHIRLSIRADETKIGINLIYGSSRTPWHMSLMADGKTIKLMARAALEGQKETSPYAIETIDIEDIGLKYIRR
jgi:pyoverdine/dityrosine biosynthesis protein Dit1